MASFDDITSAGADVINDLGDRASDMADIVSKKTKKALKNLKHLQEGVQENLDAGRSQIQDKWEEGSHQVGERMAQLGSRLRDTRETTRKRYKRYQRRRARSRTLFRWGILIGCVFALLYTPVPGVEIRRRIARLWQQKAPSPERERVPV